MSVSLEDDVKSNGNKALLNKGYIINKNKRQGDTQHFDKTK